MKILYIVRRFGPVGGMERYVWEVVNALAAMGHQVEVLCQRSYQQPAQSVVVHQLGEIAVRPRWLSALRFSKRVTEWLQQNPHDDFLIHSHERVAVHQMTTFHGPPFATVKDKPWWKRVSIRVAVKLYLERRELELAQQVIPNSQVIRELLQHYYPDLSARLTAPVEPGVFINQQTRPQRPIPADGGTILFVGKEWKRKGLMFACQVIRQLLKQRPALKFQVVGPPPEEVKSLFAGWQADNYELIGWQEDTLQYFHDADVLFHPAAAEPFGMVISEAMSVQLPVVVSSACGAASLVGDEAGQVMALNEPIKRWVAALEQQLTRQQPPPVYQRSWNQVAQENLALYNEFKI